ncbi:response regulator [Novosphingobium sp. NDB2Meth1]|uniref:response regulator n=1 Tax=Novosphingobium sp. NDB2Meth1 TaxID=1892847 RepID=UPI000931E41F|nr:response regulator [Novosphingobium sp. NDB2Meth1]
MIDPEREAPFRILVVDDDDALRTLVREFLESHGFEVHEANGGTEMRALLRRQPVDVVVLDVMMPGEDGLALARELVLSSEVGVIMVSALGQETDRIVGLEVGADDYLAKPVSPRELVARIRALLRRRRTGGGGGGEHEKRRFYHFAGWTCDMHRRILRDPAEVVTPLSVGEFALLRAFLERPQRVLTRDYLLDITRGDDSDAFDRAIDSQVSRLRRKLAQRSQIELIQTIRNEGYIFAAKVDVR